MSELKPTTLEIVQLELDGKATPEYKQFLANDPERWLRGLERYKAQQKNRRMEILATGPKLVPAQHIELRDLKQRMKRINVRLQEVTHLVAVANKAKKPKTPQSGPQMRRLHDPFAVVVPPIKEKPTKRNKPKVLMLIGQANNERGRSNEERVLEAFMGAYRKPEWLLTVKKAPLELDRQGADIIVDTTHGTCYVQVKSSMTGVREFLAKDHALPVLPIRVGPLDRPEEIRHRVYAVAHKLLPLRSAPETNRGTMRL